MKTILANKTSILYNVGLLILLFTYPVANLTRASAVENNTELDEKILPNSSNIQNHQQMKFDITDSTKIISNNIYLVTKFK